MIQPSMGIGLTQDRLGPRNRREPEAGIQAVAVACPTAPRAVGDCGKSQGGVTPLRRCEERWDVLHDIGARTMPARLSSRVHHDPEDRRQVVVADHRPPAPTVGCREGERDMCVRCSRDPARARRIRHLVSSRRASLRRACSYTLEAAHRISTLADPVPSVLHSGASESRPEMPQPVVSLHCKAACVNPIPMQPSATRYHVT